MFWSVILIILAHERVYVWGAGASRMHEYYEALTDGAVHDEFVGRFSGEGSLSRAVDDLIERLMREEEACRQQNDQCDNDAEDQEDHGNEHKPNKPDNIVAPPTHKPDTGGGGEEGQGQGHGQEDGGEDGGSNNEAAPGKRFYIESTFSEKVVEITPGGDEVEGEKIQMWEKRGGSEARQLWVLGEDNTIRSALHTNMEFTDSSKESRLAQALRALLEDDRSAREGLERVGDLKGLEMHPVKSQYKGGRWRVKGEMIINEAGYALTIRDASRENGARLIQHDTEHEAHKIWKLVYV